MKPNEKKMYQAGGYITYQPIPLIPPPQEQVQAGDQRTAAEEKEDQPLSGELIKSLLGKGLTNDVMQYSQMVNQAYFQYSRMSDLAKNTYKGRQLRMIMKGDLGQLNALVRAKDDMDQALKTAHEQGSDNEYAVTPQGMVVKDLTDGKVKTVSFQQYAADNGNASKKFQPLTNSDLANEREFNTSLIGRTDLASVVGYGKGMDKVKEEVMKYISNVAASSSSVSSGGYGDSAEVEDAKALMSAAASGMFKLKEGHTVITNLPQLRKAETAMWMNLSDNAKATLRARAASMVSNPAEIEQTAMGLATSLMEPSGYQNEKTVHDLTGKRGLGGGSGSGKEAEIGLGQLAMHNKTTLAPVNFTVPTSDGKDAVALSTLGSDFPNYFFTNDKNERTTLQNNGKLDQAGYTDQAFTANGDPVNKDNTVITGGARVVTLPVVMGAKGVMQIDTDGAQRYLQMQKEFDSLPKDKQTPLKESELMTKHNIDSHNLRKLIMADVTSFANSYIDGLDERFYKKVKDPSELDYVGNIVDPDSKTVRHWLDNSAYKHAIFIPMKSEAEVRAADGNKITIPGVAASALVVTAGPQGSNISQGTPWESGVDPSSTTLTPNFWLQQ